MNDKLKQLALEIGGSHYPVVSKQYFEQTVRLIVKECSQALGDANAETTLLNHFNLK